MTDTTTPLPRSSTGGGAWTAQLNELRVREKAHTREGDAIAATQTREQTSGGARSREHAGARSG